LLPEDGPVDAIRGREMIESEEWRDDREREERDRHVDDREREKRDGCRDR
jgi:hypothetical protein